MGGVTYTLIPSWVNSLSDPVIESDMEAAFVDGSVTENGLAKLFSDLASELTQNSTTLTASQFQDLKTISSNLNSSIATPYLNYITNAFVNGNTANATYTGGAATSLPLGNLAVGSTATQINELNSKWFLGTDLPLNFYHTNGKDSPFDDTPKSVSFSYQSTSVPLYSTIAGPSFNDVNQGDLGDCFFLSPLAEVAQQNPTIISSMITDNGNGTYGVRFYVNGNPEYVTTSASFAGGTKYNSGGPLFNAYNISGDIWANILENAYAQIQASGNITGMGSGVAANSFTLLDSGLDYMTLPEITGATLTAVFTGSKSTGTWSQTNYASQNSSDTGSISSATLFQQIENALLARNDVILTSNVQKMGFNNLSTLETSHDMSVIGIDPTSNALIIRNPWGTISWQNWQTVFEVSLDTLLNYDDSITIDNAGSIVPAAYTNAIVNNWFQSIQFQSPAASNISDIVAQLNSGSLAQSQVWNDILTSSYTTNYVNPVIEAFQAIFNRIPDIQGEQFWVGQSASGVSIKNLYQAFGQSAEFQKIYKTTGDTTASLATIQSMYANAFGTVAANADTAGENWWFAQNLPNWEVAFYIGTSSQASSTMAQAIHGYELTQIAGNSGSIPTSISLFSFGGTTV